MEEPVPVQIRVGTPIKSMYLVKVEAKDSPIEGKGVFALEDIKEGTIAWKFDPSHDQSMSSEDFEALDDKSRTQLLRVAYLSKSSGRWVYPPNDDPALFTNHSESNNLSVAHDTAISGEPFFRANRDIRSGEELTVNYTEFDARPEDQVLDWE